MTVAKQALSRTVVIDALRGLGKDANEYARTLERLGITGRIGGGAYCPMAVWAHKAFADYLDQLKDEVRFGWTIIIDGVRLWQSNQDVPRAVWDFMMKFDMRMYPKLIRAERG